MELCVSFEKRRKAKEEFYLEAIGALIRKQRLKMKMSQMELALGICSNTYVSKLENNHATPSWDQLMMLMERVKLDPNKVSFPHEALDYLERAMDCFYRADYKGYRAIIEEIDKYEFAILLELVHFGYHVLVEDFDAARDYYNNLFRYLSSLEDYGFAVFLLFSCFYNHGIGEETRARSILDKIEDRFMMTRQINAMFAFVSVQVYGNLRMHDRMHCAYEQSLTDFTNHFNTSRLVQLMVARKMHRMDEEGFDESLIDDNDLNFLMPVTKAKYLLKLASVSKTPEKYLSMIEENNPYRGLALCRLAETHAEQGDEDKYEATIETLKNHQSGRDATLDFMRLLELKKEDDSLEYKEFLSKHVLPKAIDTGDVNDIEHVIDTIVGILKKNSRYKDALSYRKKFKKICEKFRSEVKGNWTE